MKFCEDALLILFLDRRHPSLLHGLKLNALLHLVSREGMFQLAARTHFEFLSNQKRERRWIKLFSPPRKRRDLWQKEEPVEEKAGGRQNRPGGSSGNIPEVAEFNHNLE